MASATNPLSPIAVHVLGSLLLLPGPVGVSGCNGNRETGEAAASGPECRAATAECVDSPREGDLLDALDATGLDVATDEVAEAQGAESSNTPDGLGAPDVASTDGMPDGELACWEVFACLDSCGKRTDPQRVQECAYGCLQSASPAGKAEYESYMECMGDVPPDCFFDGTDCPENPCEEELFHCCDAEGTRSCRDSYLCALDRLSMSKPGWDCGGACLQLASVAEWRFVRDVWSCVSGLAPCEEDGPVVPAGCLDAIFAQCIEPINKCVAEGTACAELSDCLVGEAAAKGLVLAFLGCAAGGTPEAQAGLLDLANCLLQNCGKNPVSSCIDGALVGACHAVALACIEGAS